MHRRVIVVENPFISCLPDTPGHKYDDLHEEGNSEMPPDSVDDMKHRS
jgi:hypothetical protein